MPTKASTDLVRALSTVDTAVLRAAARMAEHLRTAPDLMTASVDPAGFGIEEESPRWKAFIDAIEEFDRGRGGETHDILARYLGEFTSAVNAALAERGVS